MAFNRDFTNIYYRGITTPYRSYTFIWIGVFSVSTSTQQEKQVQNQVSVGAGLAIAGVWLACAAVNIIVMMILFVWSGPIASSGSSDGGLFGLLMIIAMIAAPLIAAYSITKKILNKDD